MKRHSRLLLILAIVLSLAVATGSTIAYLQDTDADVNVMTLGNVHINQLEYERVPQEGHEATNDAWVSTGEEDKYGYVPDEVREFSQAKPLLPAVFADGVIKWDDRTDTHQQSWADVKGEKVNGAPGSNQMFDDSVRNTIDKVVFVENTGASDAYVRTWFAFEQGSVAAEDFPKVVMTNTNAGHWAWETVATDVEIDGNTYVVKVATYLGPKANPTQVLAPGTISYPSLLQLYMKPEAGNAEVEAIDGNKNGMYDVLVLSQAVQAQGFDSAEAALDEAFGDATVANIPWDVVTGPIIVYNADELRQAMKIEGAEIYLGDDILVDDDNGTGYAFYAKYDNKIHLNGHDITVDMPGKVFNGVFYALNGAQLDIVGDGDVTIAGGVGQFVWCTGASGDTQVNIYGGNWVQDSPDFGSEYCEGLYANRAGEVNIYGGTFDWGDFAKYTVNESREGVATVYGGSFANFDPQVSHDSDGSYLADGHQVTTSTDANGDTWYTVTK